MTNRLGQSVAGLSAVLCLAAAGPAFADFDYNYAELRYVDTEIDFGPADLEGDGFEIGGALELTPAVHLFGNFRTLDFNAGIDASAFEVGGGYALPLATGADLVARLSYIDGEVEDADDSGFGFSAGFRHMFRPQFEGRAFINYVDLDESGDETTFELAGDWFLNEEIALGASLELGDDVTTWTLGGRWYFGARRR